MNRRDYDTTIARIARIAGNIAAGLVRADDVGAASSDPAYRAQVADLAVDLARRIVARVRETAPLDLTPSDRRDHLDEIAATLSARVWDPDTLDAIAIILRHAGYTIAEPES